MSKHRKHDDNDETDIIAVVKEEPQMVLLADWLKEHPEFSLSKSDHFVPMFRGMDPTDPTIEPVADADAESPPPAPPPDRPKSRRLLAVTVLALLLSLAAAGSAVWMVLSKPKCHQYHPIPVTVTVTPTEAP